MRIKLAMIAAMTFASLAFGLAGERSFRVTLRVVDDEGKPLPEANARVSFEHVHAAKESERVGASKGITDAEGRVTLEGKTGEASVGYDAEMPGHYQTWGLRYNFTGTKMFRWQPWNPTIEVVLKRKKNPVPMYAKRLALSLPKLDEQVGYDLVVGDWVIPNGQGKVSDMIFMGELHQGGDRKFDWKLRVTFSNPGAGIQRFMPDSESAGFRSAYKAPDEGYLSEWKLRRWRTGPAEPEKTTFDGKAGYYFRVRTVLDRDGKVVKALYGKIYGDFFDMVYYLNPDSTRNMEFDPKKNLLEWAKPRERDLYEVGP